MIRYTAVLSSGLSATGARKHFGLGAVQQRAVKVENVVEEVKAIRLAFESVANIQESATLAQFGITSNSDMSSSESESDEDDAGEIPDLTHTEGSFSKDDILALLKAGQWNWFDVVAEAEEKGLAMSLVGSEYSPIISDLTDPKLSLVCQSHAAFLEVVRTEEPSKTREGAALNGEVVSESDSDDPDDYTDNDRAKAVLKKKIQAIRRKCRRDRVKLVVQKLENQGAPREVIQVQVFIWNCCSIMCCQKS